MNRKTEITYEVEEAVVIRHSGEHSFRFCPNCAETVEMMPPHVLAKLSGTSERKIFRLIETETIYFEENERTVACPICFTKLIADVEIT